MGGKFLTKSNQESIINLYLNEKLSIPQISDKLITARSTIYFFLKRNNCLRTRKDAINIAAKESRVGGIKGGKRFFTEEWKKNLSASLTKRGEKFAKGFSLKPNGYLEITRGENKGRLLHVVMMESKIGRKLFCNECVHHIDQCKTNNNLSNLQLMTKSEHTRLHRELDKINNLNRKRSKNGRFN